MYEARQCKEKVSRRIDATGGGTSQKKHINYDWQSILNVMQRAHDLTCKTKIDYIHKGEIKSSEGDGENDIADANSVLQIIRAHPQTHWISLQPQVGKNIPGKCAEPHSLANALKIAIQPTDKIIKVTQYPAKFKNDYYRKYVKIPQDEFKDLKKKYKYGTKKFWNKMDKKRLEHAINNGYRTFAPKYIKGEQYPLCPTCEQWVPKLPKIGIDNREKSYNDIGGSEYSSESYRYEHIFSHLE